MTKKIKIYLTDKDTGEVFARHQEIVTFDGVGHVKRLQDFYNGFTRQMLLHSNGLIQMEFDNYTPPTPTTIF